MKRSTTPPSASYLLTPPATGGFDKRNEFFDNNLPNTSSTRTNKSNEGDSPTAFFDDVQEGSDAEVDGSDEEPVSVSDDTPLASPTTDISVTSENSFVEKHDGFNPQSAPIFARVVDQPFPFLELPLSVRNKVYEDLLVVPGLICVRQQYRSLEEEDAGYLHPEAHQLLPGIAHVKAQLTVNGTKAPFSHCAFTNVNILYASKEIYKEAKAVLYSRNNFETARPSTELSPPADFSVRLFPPGCQRLVTKLNVCIRSFYDLNWLLSGGYNDIKNFYRGLCSLTLILEFDSIDKGFARKWVKQEEEKWNIYIKRLQIEVAKDAFTVGHGKKVKTVPTWINLRVLYGGESYNEKLPATTSGKLAQQARRDELRNALVEVWERFKKGDR